jgi:polyvinyl alcohol dehydrogenase (cytochrome)
MKAAKIVWDEAAVDRFIAGPDQLVPGTSMSYVGLTDTHARADLIAYLEEATASSGGTAAEPELSAIKLGEAVYEQRCAICHDHPQERIPPKEFLQFRPHDYIVNALTSGPMKPEAIGLSSAQIDGVATYLRASLPAKYHRADFVEPDLRANRCKSAGAALSVADSDWNGWSPDLENSRFQRRPGLLATEVSKLKPKWVFAYPGSFAYGPPSVAGGRVFIGTIVGNVVSLDAKTGCTHWVTESGASVKTAITLGAWPSQLKQGAKRVRYAAYFGDTRAVVRAVNAETGEELWTAKADEHAFANISATPKLFQGRLYVPVTAGEGLMGTRGDYSCCTLRGSITVLDAVTGKLLWKTYTIAEEPKPFKVNRTGTQMYGPAGASVWSSPTLDVKSGQVFAATGQSRTDVSTEAADAIISFDLRSGERRWLMQATANDNWNQGCDPPTPGPNCPDPLGPDSDFGSPPILRALGNGQRVLMGGQKSGVVHGLDPDANGKELWRVNLAKDVVVPPGVILRDRQQSGVVFGMAADANKLYVAIADPDKRPGHIPLGVFALKISTGQILWHAPGAAVPSCSWGANGCTGAQRTAVTVMPGVVFAGSANGHMRAYDANDGSVLWDFDTGQSFHAVNGVEARGGSIEGSATALAGSALYVMSGYASYGGGIGNALIAFTVNGK